MGFRFCRVLRKEQTYQPISFQLINIRQTLSGKRLMTPSRQLAAEPPEHLCVKTTQNVFSAGEAVKPVFYTEWNSSSNPRDELHDEPYAAAFIAKTILESNGSG